VEYLPFVWRNVQRLLGVTSGTDDVVQDVFVVVLRRLPEFEGRSTFRSWLYGILRRTVADHRKRLRGRGTRDSRTELDALEGRDSGPHRRAEKLEAAQIAELVLAQIDEDKREVFVLAELEGMTAPEIAEITGAGVTTVHARLRDARRKFKTLAHKYYGDAVDLEATGGRP
jgi:RNA polymerase sigma-70 factor (ECF subfamily)